MNAQVTNGVAKLDDPYCSCRIYTDNLIIIHQIVGFFGFLFLIAVTIISKFYVILLAIPSLIVVNIFERRYFDMYWIYAYRQKKFQDMVAEIEAIQRATP